jgi:cyclophilin family peptidyl-prolyl cis-trans isomerase
MKKFINPSLIFYLLVIIVITLLIGYASGNSSSVKPLENKETKIIKIMNKEKQIVTLVTNLGNIDLELDPNKAPLTVENFVKLAKDGFYDNTKFHRVIKGFMVQGGDPYSKGEDISVYGTGGPGYKFADEQNDLPMVAGTLAMANSGPNTNGSQFFIVTAAETPWLVGKHTVFGRVIDGMDVVNKIENSRTNQNDLPVTPIVVTKVIVK